MAVDKTKDIQVGGTLHSIATGNIIAHADEVMDEDYGKKQSVINQELSNRLTEELKGYLPLTGGTMTGNITFPNTLGILIQNKTNTDLLNAAGGTTTIDTVRDGLATKDEVDEAVNDINDSIQNVKDTYLPLAGGTMNSNATVSFPVDSSNVLLEVSSSQVRLTGDGMNSIATLNSEGLTVSDTSGPSTRIRGGSIVFSPGQDPNQSYLDIEGTKYRKDGVTISGKTATDLLNAAGGTTAIADLASNYVTLDTSQTITGRKNFSQGVVITSRVTESTPEDIIIGAQLANIANPSIGINVAETDSFGIFTGGSSDKGFAVIASGDNDSSNAEPIFVAQTNTETATITKLITLMDATGNQKFNQVTATGYTIEGKTANDILIANGSTTVLKTIGGESLLGTGNIEITTNEDIEALFI